MTALDLRSYDVGYRDGENSAHADWFMALEDVLPDDIDPDDVTPSRVAALLADAYRRLAWQGLATVEPPPSKSDT